MIPRVYYALSLLLFFCTPKTTANAATSSKVDAFNVSLKDEAGKSTNAEPRIHYTTPRVRLEGLRSQVTTPRASEFCNPKPAPFTVVLDAGHGGKDPGGMGKNSHEKAIALKITQLLAIGIRTNFPNVNVVMTRSDDTFIPLYERAQIANDAGADLFVSIHANIMPGGTSTYGTETFVMGQHVAKQNLAVAKRENASILLEDNVEKNYGYDPNSDEGHIMMSTFQHAFLERSILFADLVESQFKKAGRKSRGVKQAGFAVLKLTTMPAVLVETGFMSNPKEETYLLSGVGQQKLANAILKAFAVYYDKLGDNTTNSSPVAAVSASAPTPVFSTFSPPESTTPTVPQQRSVNVFDREIALSSPPTPARRKQWTARGVSPQPITYRSPQPVGIKPPPSPTSRPISRPQPVAYGTPLSGGNYEQPATPHNQELADLLSREVTSSLRSPSVYEQARNAPQPAAITPPADSTPYKFKRAKTKMPPPAAKGIDLTNISDSQLTYAVQLIATKRNLDLTTPQWTRLSYPIRKIQESGYNKYQIRGLANAAEARDAKSDAREAGITEAMVVVYYQGKRLHAQHVRYLLAR